MTWLNARKSYMLPVNIYIHKLKKPKDWSYPVKTSDLLEHLDLAKLKRNVNIFYDNTPRRPYKSGKNSRPSYSFDIFSMTYYGHLPENSENTDSPYFHLCINVCQSEYRLRLQAAFIEVVPKIMSWIDKVQKIKSTNSIVFKYEDFSEYSDPKLVLAENKIEVFSIKLDLKKDG